MHKSVFAFFSTLKECAAMSVGNILGNRMRSLLTILGITIGITAVIALITTVSGFSGSLSESFLSMGAGTLTVNITGSDLKSGLSTEDLNALTDMDIVEGISPTVTKSCRISRGGNRETGISVSGKSSYYFATHEDLVLRGRALNVVDENNRTAVALIDSDLIETYFYGVDPLGETLYVDGLPFLIVGVFDSDADQSVATLFGGSPDVLIPYTTAMKLSNVNSITSFSVTLSQSGAKDSEVASDVLESKLDELFSYEEDCYTITSMSGIEDTMEQMLSMMTTLLAGIASIALLVGGIGIMNMMLTGVTERTAEIGLRKALGALPWQILAQFLMESFLLSILGGITGVLLGLLLSFGLCRTMGASFALNGGAIALGVGFSAAVGILFGWAPARKAAHLNPIDALRAI